MGRESWATSPTSRKVMLGNRSRDTKPELAVRRLLHSMGYRYRVAYRPIPTLRRTADIVFTRQRVAVFIDGCYWHACPVHGTTAKSNAEYWSQKLISNVARDSDTNARLRQAGWTVLRFWEHEPPDEVVTQIVRHLAVAESGPVPARPLALTRLGQHRTDNANSLMGTGCASGAADVASEHLLAPVYDLRG